LTASLTVDIRPRPEDVERFPSELAGATLQGVWTPNGAEKQAAWQVLVELVTRISVVPLSQNEGLLREAISSIYQLFDVGRAALKIDAAVAEERPGELSFAVIVAHLLNQVLRPTLSTWHPALRRYEVETGTSSAPTREIELDWDHHDHVRDLLDALRAVITEHARLYAKACNAAEFVRFLLQPYNSPSTGGAQ
jgi:hypothetical protein